MTALLVIQSHQFRIQDLWIVYDRGSEVHEGHAHQIWFADVLLQELAKCASERLDQLYKGSIVNHYALILR